MAKLVMLVCLMCIYAAALAKPADPNSLDKATFNDVSINSVSGPDRQNEQNGAPVNKLGKFESSATVEISGITTGIDATKETPHSEIGQPFTPQRAGTMFSRFIDDIFNIPITVLQSVAKLITNPFSQRNKTPESS